jgi:GNAT superfamily N-acetyltransferase
MKLATPTKLIEHLAEWLGDWPGTSGISVVTSRRRTEPGWDGKIHDFIGVLASDRGVISVPEPAVEMVSKFVHGFDVDACIQRLRQHPHDLDAALGHDATVGVGVFRWSDSPAALPHAGDWTSTDDPRVPDWLKSFNGDVLIEWDNDGIYGAGVGRKHHDHFGHEISVGTQESLRGRGIARRLVATAAKQIVNDGAVATYIHDADNYASARVADATGFDDVGWRMLGLWG